MVTGSPSLSSRTVQIAIEEALPAATVTMDATLPEPEPWAALLDRLACPEFETSPAYLASLRSRHDPGRFCIAKIYDGVTLIGVIPLTTERGTLDFRVGERRLFGLPIRKGRILGRSPALEAPRHFSDFLETSRLSRPSLDYLEIMSLPVDTPLWEHLHSSDLNPGYFAYAPFRSTLRQTLTLGATWDDYMHQRSRNFREQMRRKDRKIRRKYGADGVRITCIRTPEQVPGFLQDVACILERCWQRRLGATMDVDDLGDRGQAHFLRMAEATVLRAYVLHLNGDPAAFVLGTQYRGVFHVKELAYAAEYGGHGPGTVLMYNVIRDLHAADPPYLCDFGYGDARYKREFSTEATVVSTVWIVRKRAYTRLVFGLHRAVMLLHRAAGDVLARLGWKSKVLAWLKR